MATAFRQTLGALFVMIVATSARSKPADQNHSAAKIKVAISALPSEEFPNLVGLSGALIQEAAKGATEEPTLSLAKAYVDRVLTEFSAK